MAGSSTFAIKDAFANGPNPQGRLDGARIAHSIWGYSVDSERTRQVDKVKSLVGQIFGSYEVKAMLGAGGMGEVYRAWDSRLRRDVALKVLPEGFSKDSDRVLRFQREAEILASLNHPHISAIYDFAEFGTLRFLILELVEGQTIGDRLSRGPIPVDEALRIAAQITEALEAAHEKEIIHRDLKPANIKLTPDGKVKVLDFGLAKANVTPGGDPTNSPTKVTVSGVATILGTPAYMSPEQVRGEPGGKQSDIWAFGCVLFEMLTGQSPFAKATIAETVARVIEATPDFRSLPEKTPPLVRRLLRRCLEKNPSERLHHIGDARVDIREAHAATSTEVVQPEISAGRRRQKQLLGVAGLSIAVALAAIALWLQTEGTGDNRPAAILRFELTPANLGRVGPLAAISSDGTQLAYPAGNRAISIRRLDRLDNIVLQDLGDRPTNVFFSPDGKWVAYFESPAAVLKKVPSSGGPAVRIAVSGANPGAGGSWGSDNRIVFMGSGGRLFRVSVEGGEPEMLATPSVERGEVRYAWPEVLPDARSVLFTIIYQGSGVGTEVAVLNLETRKMRTLFRGGSMARYVPTGHLVYLAGDTLEARAFDPDALEVRGDPVSLNIRVATLALRGGQFDLSSNGTLVYVAGGGDVPVDRALVWVDRDGLEQPLTAAPPGNYAYARISPDARQVALDYTKPRETNRDIWLLDLIRESIEPLAKDPGNDAIPAWSPDGRFVYFASEIGGAYNMFRQAADGSGAAERLFESPNRQMNGFPTPDGKQLLIVYDNPDTGADVGLLTLEQPRTIKPLIQSPSAEINPRVSGDGRWLLYQSDESGGSEIYVRPFPEVDRRRWRISTGGGAQPVWAIGRNELYFFGPKLDMMAVPFDVTPDFTPGKPRMLFPNRDYTDGIGAVPYDVATDGRFLMLKRITQREEGESRNFTVVVNWLEELKKVVPAP